MKLKMTPDTMSKYLISHLQYVKHSWVRGEGLPNLWTPIAFRGDWNLGEHCAIVYAQGDVPFKVLQIAID